MRRCLFITTKLMKRLTKDRSAKASTRAKTISKAKNAEETSETDKRTTRSTVKNETSLNLLANSTDIKPIKEVAIDASESASKIDLSNFHFKREQKPLLVSSSPKKRQHIKVEYDDVSPSKVKKEDGKPLHWEAVLNNLREMRKNRDAPVDSMGCQKCPDENESPEIRRYQTLISLMLSSQTKDQVTHAAMTRLKEHGCTVDNILNTTDEKLGELIYPVGFWKSKVKYIKKTTEILKNEYNGDIPNTIDNLCKLSGVGPKMAHLCMQTAWGEVTGIGVDTHVHRICNRMGWVKSKTPEETRKGLEKWLPRELWSEVNHLLVGFGQQICTPLKPQCATCLNLEMCPFGVKNIKGKIKT